jgi:hypothetical protein
MASVELAACAGAARAFDRVSLEQAGRDVSGGFGCALRLGFYRPAEEAERVDCTARLRCGAEAVRAGRSRCGLPLPAPLTSAQKLPQPVDSAQGIGSGCRRVI